MAFKRSAVRSRLSPPKILKTIGFRDFFFAFLVELLLIIGAFLIGNFDDADCGKASRLTVSCRMES